MLADNDNLASEILRGADQIARFMGLTRRAIYHAAANGTIPVFRMGETILARKSTLMGWIADQEQTARTARAA